MTIYVLQSDSGFEDTVIGAYLERQTALQEQALWESHVGTPSVVLTVELDKSAAPRIKEISRFIQNSEPAGKERGEDARLVFARSMLGLTLRGQATVDEDGEYRLAS